MAGIATIDDERIVSSPEDRVLFMSRRSELQLYKKSARAIRDPHTGEVVDEVPGEVVSFVDGQLRFDGHGSVTVMHSLTGAEWETDAQALTDWLLKHRLYGNREEGFWRVDPTAPAISKDELKALMRAAQRFDVDALERALAEERAGWDRPDVIEVIEENIAETRQMIAELEAEKAETERLEAEAAAKAEADRKAAEKAARDAEKAAAKAKAEAEKTGE